MKRQILSILLALCLLVNLVPYVTPTASAASYSGECGANLTWTFDADTGILHISGTGEMTNWSYADSVSWYDYRFEIRSVEIDSGVTSIGNYAFKDCSLLTSVTIPDSVTSIGHSAFYKCTELTNLTIPDSVTSIGHSAFYYCSGLKSVTIGNGVTSILFFTFSECTSLTDITIPNSVTSIGENAFTYCTGLTSVTIPDSVTSIGNSAFEGCFELTSVTIPSSVTSIGDCAFTDCRNLKSIIVDEANQHFTNDIHGILYSKDLTTLIACPGGYSGSYSIPDSVTSIGSHAFRFSTWLTNIAIGTNVTSIGNYAFFFCSRLTEVTIPDSMTSIGDYAFDGCVELTDVYYTGTEEMWNKIALENSNEPLLNAVIHFRPALDTPIPDYSGTCGENLTWELYIDTGLLRISGTGPMTSWSTASSVPWYSYHSEVRSVEIASGVTSIGNQAFCDCDGLTSVTIPDSVTFIGKRAFYDCRRLTSVTMGNGVTSIGDNAFAYCKSLASVTIPDSVVTIGDSAFWYCDGLTSLTIGNSVISIGASAFGYCDLLTSVTIPNSVTSIGNYTFAYCSGLISVTIPNSVTSIGNYTFAYCSGLISVTIPESVTSIGTYAFYDCTSLQRFTVNEANQYFASDASGVLYNKDATTLIACPGAYSGSYSIPDTVTYISYSAFRCCNGLTSVTIPNSVIYIGHYAFSDCFGLTDVTIPNSVTSIGNYAFSHCYGLIDLTIGNGVTTIGKAAFSDCSALTEVTIPNNVTSIGGAAFSGCYELTCVTIGSGVTTIDEYVFRDCTALKRIKVDEANQYYTSDAQGALYNKDVTSLIVCPAGYSGGYIVPDSATSISDYAFSDCYELTGLIMGNGVTTIGEWAFSRCYKLTSITIGNSVTTIGDWAFYYCDGLTSVTIPTSVTSIGDRAFDDCECLRDVYYTGTEEMWNEIWIGSYNSSLLNATIHFESVPIPGYRGTCGENLTWILNTDTNVLYVSGTGQMTNWAEGDAPWYPYRSEIQSVEINSGVTSIGDYAFADCPALISVTIPDSVTSIGYSAFLYCDRLRVVYYTGTRELWDEIWIEFDNYPLLDASIYFEFIPSTNTCTGICGENLTWMFETDTGILHISGTGQMTNWTEGGAPWYSFCSEIQAIEIDSGVTSIGDYAFSECYQLTDMTIPDGVTYIGDHAFFYCNGLTGAIIIPDSVTFLGDFAFSDCHKMTGVTIGNGVTSIGKWVFSACEGLTNVTIPDSVTSIGDSAFSGCNGLTNVTIPDSVTSIGDSAFFSCNGLTGVTIPGSVTSIGVRAFYNCDGLTGVTIGNGVTTIGYSAFFSCNVLTGVIIIPDSVTYIARSAFSDCTALQRFEVGEANQYYTNDAQGVLYNKDVTSLIAFPGGYSGDYIVPNGVTSIGDYAFSYCAGLTAVTIPDSVTSIGELAFSYCAGLTAVTLPDSVTSIGRRSFFCCTALQRIKVDEANRCFTSDAQGALYNKDVTSLIVCPGGYSGSYVIPNSVISITEFAFGHCNALTNVTIPDSVTSIGDAVFSGCTGLTGVTIGNSVTSISKYMFNECTGLTEVTIGTGVTSIADFAFSDCDSLSDVYYPGTKEMWNDIAIGFSNSPLTRATMHFEFVPTTTYSGTCGETLTWTLNADTGVLHVSGTGQMTNWTEGGAPWCPYRSNIQSVEIDSGVTSIGDYAFADCTALTAVTVPDSVTSIGDYAFSGCTGLPSVGLDAVRKRSSGLTGVTIGNGVKTIGDYAFYGCTGLTNVTMPDSVISIGDSAFFDCTGLTGVTIPGSVTAIGCGVFDGCTALTEVRYTGTEEMWNQIEIEDGNDVLLDATIQFSDPEVRDIQIRHTLDLASDISITFAVAKADLADYDSYYLECTLPEYKGNELVGASTVTIEPVINGNYYYFTLTGITAIRMGDMVEAVLHMTRDGKEYISNTDNYSVATYAYAMLNNTTDAKMLTLCADLLRYGAEAQSFKQYRTDSLVDAAMTETHRNYLSDTATLTFTATDSYLGNLESPTITWVGKTLDLGSKVGMKFVFDASNYSGDIANLSMKVSYTGSTGETKTATLTGAEVYSAANSYYSFTFYGLLASELRTIVDVAIYEGETQRSETLRYSAESYASKTAGTTLEPLTRALFAYSDSAKAFFAK